MHFYLQSSIYPSVAPNIHNLKQDLRAAHSTVHQIWTCYDSPECSWQLKKGYWKINTAKNKRNHQKVCSEPQI
jgi:hypothetical protein